MFEIETGIPKPKCNTGPEQKYPFDKLEVGQSFFVPDIRASQFAGRKSYWEKATGRKFSTRSVDGGVRVWRDA